MTLLRNWTWLRTSIEKQEDKLAKGVKKQFDFLNEKIEKMFVKIAKYQEQTDLLKKGDQFSKKLSGDLDRYANKIEELKKEHQALSSIDDKMKEARFLEKESKELLSSAAI